jgi:uncharacterized protein YkwD
MNNRFVSMGLALALAGCANAPSPSQPPAIGMKVEALKMRLFALVQEERRRMDMSARPLALDPELSVAAQAHSNDMAAKGSFDTGTPNVAIRTLLQDPNFHGYVGENSAEQYFSLATGFDPDTIARGFLAIWMASPSHESNLLDVRFDRTGIGIAVRGNQIYAAEVFATDLGQSQPRQSQ